MAELSVGVDLTRVEDFPAEGLLRHHKDLVARYGPAKEVVAAFVPAQQILAELPRDVAP
jgi:ATP sulfurylase